MSKSTTRKPNPEADDALVADFRSLEDALKIHAPNNNQLRIYTTSVRRLVLDKGITLCSTPRGVKLEFEALDNMPFIRNHRRGRSLFWAGGGVTVTGCSVRGFTLEVGQGSADDAWDDGDFDRRFPLDLDSFLRQPVMQYKSIDITRRDLISYICNKIGPAHLDLKREGKYLTLDMLRHCVSMRISDEGILQIEHDLQRVLVENPEFKVLRTGIDMVYAEFLSTVDAIVNSPSIRTLVELIEQELSL